MKTFGEPINKQDFFKTKKISYLLPPGCWPGRLQIHRKLKERYVLAPNQNSNSTQLHKFFKYIPLTTRVSILLFGIRWLRIGFSLLTSKPRTTRTSTVWFSTGTKPTSTAAAWSSSTLLSKIKIVKWLFLKLQFVIWRKKSCAHWIYRFTRHFSRQITKCHTR